MKKPDRASLFRTWFIQLLCTCIVSPSLSSSSPYQWLLLIDRLSILTSHFKRYFVRLITAHPTQADVQFILIWPSGRILPISFIQPGQAAEDSGSISKCAEWLDFAGRRLSLGVPSALGSPYLPFINSSLAMTFHPARQRFLILARYYEVFTSRRVSFPLSLSFSLLCIILPPVFTLSP